MHHKVSRKLKVLRALVALFFLPIVLFGVITAYATLTDSDGRQYEKMKQTCQTEMWAIVYDSPWHHVQEIEKPYPPKVEDVIAGGPVVGLACSQQEATEQSRLLKNSGGITYFVGMSLVLVAPVVLAIVLWWITDESRYWRAQRTAK